jgi:hypothetical protein
MDKLDRIKAQQTLQVVMRYVQSLHNALDPDSGIIVYNGYTTAYNLDLDNIIALLNDIRAI